jgi:hypothetical protein
LNKQTFISKRTSPRSIFPTYSYSSSISQPGISRLASSPTANQAKTLRLFDGLASRAVVACSAKAAARDAAGTPSGVNAFLLVHSRVLSEEFRGVFAIDVLVVTLAIVVDVVDVEWWGEETLSEKLWADRRWRGDDMYFAMLSSVRIDSDSSKFLCLIN